jgi:hypothetical protein
MVNITIDPLLTRIMQAALQNMMTTKIRYTGLAE